MVLTAISCTERDDAPFGAAGDAEVCLSVGVDATENEQAISTKTGQPTLDAAKDLAIYVINTHEDTLARWASFEAAPATLRFTPGAYKVVAEYKPAGMKIPAFDTYSYRAEEKFVVRSGDRLQLDLVAKLATSKISVEFDPSFDHYYRSYSVDIRTVGTDSLRFAKGESRCGFFKPGSVRMRFNLVTQEGRELVFSPEPLAKAKAADYYKLKLKVSSTQGDAQVIVIGSDDTNPAKEVMIEVPQYFLPKDKPSITATQGFDSGTAKSVFEGEVSKWSMAATVPGGISSFVIRMNDGANGVLGQKLGGVAEVDLAGLAKDDPVRAALKEAGFVWCEGLDSPEDATIATNVWIDFTAAMTAMADGSAAQYDFNIELTDNYGQTPDDGGTGVCPCVVKAEVKTPTVIFEAPRPGDVWTAQVDFTVKTDYDAFNGVRPKLQYRRTTAADWNDTSEGDNVTVSALPNDNGMYVLRYAMTGLQPGTEYVFRTETNGRCSDERTVTMEKDTQLPAFEYSESQTQSGYTKLQKFGDLWQTRNPATTGMKEAKVEDTKSWCVNTTYQENDWVCLQTRYWGRSEKRWGVTAHTYRWSLDRDKYRNINAGILYLGQYQYELNYHEGSTWPEGDHYYYYDKLVSETLDRGMAFASRPTALSLDYIFLPKDDDSNRDSGYIHVSIYGTDGSGTEVEIANGEFKPNPYDKKESATPLTIPITYTNTELKATKIDVFFSSSEHYGKDDNPACNGTTYLGNVLKVKNIKLNYER